MNQVIVEPERFEIAPTLENLREKAQEIFSLLLLDISSSTCEDYAYRIGLFLEFIRTFANSKVKKAEMQD